jgi:RNA polymerase subunit RPABC4/transcription elongation factor Spt4
MKSPTGELLHRRGAADAELRDSGLTGGLELYDELIDFLDLSPETQPDSGCAETPSAVTRPAPVTPPFAQTDGALSDSEDVIKITGALDGFMAPRPAGSAMTVCGDCGNLSESEALFCIHCGGLLEETAARAETAIALAGLCDECGAVVESDEIFCPTCGTVMATA